MTQKRSPEPRRERRPAAKFFGIAFEMAITIGLFVFLGKWADGLLELEKPLMTAFLSLAGVLLAIFNLIRKANRGNRG